MALANHHFSSHSSLFLSHFLSFLILLCRDIYYRHPALFAKQAVVDRYIDNIACTFGVSRLALNVVSLRKSKQNTLRLLTVDPQGRCGEGARCRMFHLPSRGWNRSRGAI